MGPFGTEFQEATPYFNATSPLPDSLGFGQVLRNIRKTRWLQTISDEIIRDRGAIKVRASGGALRFRKVKIANGNIGINFSYRWRRAVRRFWRDFAAFSYRLGMAGRFRVDLAR